MNIAILYICTGAYDVLWKEFFESYEEYFLPQSRKEYYVFTDAEYLYGEEFCERVHKVHQEKLGWPYDTLMRFHMFDSIEEELISKDYIFFMNANCKCIDFVFEKDFLPIEKDILVVQHPGFYNKKPKQFTYDRNPKSTAYIPMGQGEYYVCGGINGGKADAYLKLVKELKNNTDEDIKNNVMAKWHDESHINRYVFEHDNWQLLSPAYWYPEGWNLPYDIKIMVRDKNKYFDTIGMKNNVIKAFIKKCHRFILHVSENKK